MIPYPPPSTTAQIPVVDLAGCLADAAYPDTAELTIGDYIEQMAHASYAPA